MTEGASFFVTLIERRLVTNVIKRNIPSITKMEKKMNKINEKELHELFCKLKEKEENAYEQLYQKYASLVYRIAFSILKNQENAEDVMQNVFVKLANLSKEKLPSKYEASWLYSVTKNEAISYLRKNKEALPIEEVSKERKEDELEEFMQRDSYETMISYLENKEKQIISLKVEMGLSFKEIASLLNMPMGSVQWKYYKSLHSLKLLIGNLSLFIISATLCITNLLTKERKKVKENMQVEEEIEQKENVTLQENMKKTETLASEEKNRQEETNKKEEEKEMIQTITTVEEDNPINVIDISLISLTSIFLCFTIFFTIIFTNHQQNRKKKASKR